VEGRRRTEKMKGGREKENGEDEGWKGRWRRQKKNE